MLKDYDEIGRERFIFDGFVYRKNFKIKVSNLFNFILKNEIFDVVLFFFVGYGFVIIEGGVREGFLVISDV